MPVLHVDVERTYDSTLILRGRRGWRDCRSTSYSPSSRADSMSCSCGSPIGRSFSPNARASPISPSSDRCTCCRAGRRRERPSSSGAVRRSARTSSGSMSRLAAEAPRPSPPSARLLCGDQQLALQRCGGRIEQALARASRAERRHRAGRAAPRAIPEVQMLARD
jgi:hypothetical protein